MLSADDLAEVARSSRGDMLPVPAGTCSRMPGTSPPAMTSVAARWLHSAPLGGRRYFLPTRIEDSLRFRPVVLALARCILFRVLRFAQDGRATRTT